LNKTKTIDPILIAEIAAYSCFLPILVFLFLRYNWRERLKWVCLFLVISNFSFDQLSAYLSSKPVATGIIKNDSTELRQNFILNIHSGKIYKGQYVSAGKFSGIITHVFKDSSFQKARIKIDTKNKLINSPSPFRSFSTIRIVNIAALVEVILTFFLFHLIFKSILPWNKVTLIAMGLTITWWIINNIVLGNIHSHDSYINGTTTILVILFSLVFFYHQLNTVENRFIYLSPSFWIIFAILLYKAGTFFLLLYANTLDQDEKASFYVINSGFYFLQNMFFAIVFLVRDNSIEKNRIRK
jgi:hypothetical protein